MKSTAIAALTLFVITELASAQPLLVGKKVQFELPAAAIKNKSQMLFAYKYFYSCSIWLTQTEQMDVEMTLERCFDQRNNGTVVFKKLQTIKKGSGWEATLATNIRGKQLILAIQPDSNDVRIFDEELTSLSLTPRR